MDEDYKLIINAFIHHKDVEYKDWSTEHIGFGDTERKILESVGVKFEEKDLDYLRKLISEWNSSKTILYVGGTTRKDPAERAVEHARKKFNQMTSFYYCFVQDVKLEETALLELGGKNKLKKNVQFSSNCKAEKGGVYVLDTGLMSK